MNGDGTLRDERRTAGKSLRDGAGPGPQAGPVASPAPTSAPVPVPVPVPVPDVLVYLAGTWQVERTAHDVAGGAAGRFTGITVFGPLGGGEEAGHGLLHHESGTFVWQGTPRPAERTLRYLPGERAGTARVEFSDGRPFHDLDLGTGSYVAHHPCVADLYRGEFTVLGPDHWRTRWRVTGPAKDTLLVTDYIRRTEHRPPCA